MYKMQKNIFKPFLSFCSVDRQQGWYGTGRTTFQPKKRVNLLINTFVIIVPSTYCTNSNLIFF